MRLALPVPNITHLPAFLTPAECQGVQDEFGSRVLASPSFGSRAVYLDGKDGAADADSPLLRSIVRRASAVTGFPADRFSAPSLTMYEVGQHYGLHHDSVYVNRSGTLLVYLSAVEAGGETVFPFAAHPAAPPDATLQDVCGVADSGAVGDTRGAVGSGIGGVGVAVAPEVGAAVYWRNLHAAAAGGALAGQRDERMRHGSCPVREGRKWVLQLWVGAGGGEDNEDEGAAAGAAVEYYSAAIGSSGGSGSGEL
jgi:prolyl 4-hydroxylase